MTSATTLAQTLAVGGASTLTGLLQANGGIITDDNKFTVADTSGNVKTDGTLSVGGATSISTLATTGATTLAQTLSVGGATELSTLNTSAYHNWNYLKSDCATTLASSLAVTSATTLAQTLSVSGATHLSTLNTSGATTIDTTLKASGATTLEQL